MVFTLYSRIKEEFESTAVGLLESTSSCLKAMPAKQIGGLLKSKRSPS